MLVHAFLPVSLKQNLIQKYSDLEKKRKSLHGQVMVLLEDKKDLSYLYNNLKDQNKELETINERVNQEKMDVEKQCQSEILKVYHREQDYKFKYKECQKKLNELQSQIVRTQSSKRSSGTLL